MIATRGGFTNDDTSKLFEVFCGELKSAPLITSCPLSIECKLVQFVDLPTNTPCIAEIRNISSEKNILRTASRT